MSNLPIRVRMARLYDLYSLEVLLDKAIGESGGIMPAYDAAHCYHQAINRIESGLVYVACEIDEAKKIEKVVGCLMMDIRSVDWNPQAKLLETIHLYILPEYRARTLADGKQLVFDGLIGFGRGIADVAASQSEAPALFIVDQLFQVGPEAKADLKDKLFERAGFAYLGGKHLYIAKPAAAAA